MSTSELRLPDKWSLIHAAIGGGICFIVMFIVSDLAQGVMERILIYFGVIGVIVFQEQFALARIIILFGAVYLPSGFFGGLYTGYKVEEGLKTILAAPGVIGFSILTILTYFLGQFDPSSPDFAYRLILPLLGNIIGSYLGGYAMNWPSEEEETEEVGKLTLDVKK